MSRLLSKRAPQPTSRSLALAKPCPFCGRRLLSDDPDALYPVNRSRTLWNVVCDESGGGCGASSMGATPTEAVAAWNQMKGRPRRRR